MRICVPLAADEGLDAPVHAHFGSAPWYGVVDTEGDGIELIRNDGHHHEHGHCNPVAALLGARLDAVVVQGMGRNALARLGEAGIPVWVAGGATLGEVRDQVREGRVRALDVDGACCGHGHEGGHHHHHEHHHQQG
jgi:predicted Fe-Mo cluster-binding NifX family protein